MDGPIGGSNHDCRFQSDFRGISIDCADPGALADFWDKVLGRPVTLGAVPGDIAVEATDPDSGPWLLFHPVSEPETAKNRLRPVLLTETKLPAVRWTTFADPEGNEFDLVTWQPQ